MSSDLIGHCRRDGLIARRRFLVTLCRGMLTRKLRTQNEKVEGKDTAGFAKVGMGIVHGFTRDWLLYLCSSDNGGTYIFCFKL